MEGYSVTEAASVLGVPTERVWELLARGVLSGAPEGETGMRVYLQPRPAPAEPEAKRPNGNGRGEEPELSPFRELLTEFRGLTERYGQALLALGEARGEVATLRSRVDLLEARMDLRLPTSAPSPAASWASTPMPFPAERAVVPTVPAAHEPSPGGEHEVEGEEPRSRTRGPRRATESFAEALARAEDPSVPELPGATETAAAMATLRAETDAVLPRDLPSADAVPVAEETEPSVAEAPVETEEAVVEESDAPAAFAPGQFVETVAEVPDGPARIVPRDHVAEVAAEAADDASESAEAVHEAEADSVDDETGGIDAAEPPVDTHEIAGAPRLVEQVVEAEPVTAEESTPEPVATEPLEWDSERYTTAIEEPDWFAAEVIESPVEEPTLPFVAPEPDPEPSTDPVRETELADSAGERADETGAADEEPDEETMLWFGRAAEDSGGASEMEVATTGTRAPIEPTVTLARSFPGSSELDDALAALGVPASGRDEPAPEPVADDRKEPGPASVEDADADDWPPRSMFMDSSRPVPSSSASRAYRRLRRIFPG